MKAPLATKGLRWGYAGALSIGPLDLELGAGGHVAVVGPNGAGKSTLLRTLVGELSALEGEIALGGRSTSGLSSTERARRVAFLAQNPALDLELSVRELVELGRTPHLGLWGRMGADDHQAVASALSRCDLESLASRPLGAISGGERQRARLAMLLAQQAPLLLLDEPTTHLDLRRRHELFCLLAELLAEGLCIISVLHEPAEALREATRVLLLGRQGVQELSKDDPERRKALAEAFEVPLERISV